MKLTGLSSAMVSTAIFAACAYAQNWVYDSSAKTLTRGTVVLQNVTANGSNLTIGDNKANATATDLDFSAAIDGGWAITKISNSAFRGNTNVLDLVFPDTLTSLDGGHNFNGCSNLDCEIGAMPSGLAGTVYGIFRGCRKVHGAITIPKGLGLVNENFIDVGFQDIAFEEGTTTLNDSIKNLYSLTNLYLPSTLTELRGMTVQGCTNLVYDIGDLPQGLTFIKDWSFENTRAYGDLIWPPKCDEAKQQVFNGTLISSITAKHGLKSVGRYSFQTKALQKVVLSYETDTIHSEAFGGSMPRTFTELYFHVFPTNTTEAALGSLRDKMPATLTNYVYYGQAEWEEFAEDPGNKFTLPPTKGGIGQWGKAAVRYWRDPDEFPKATLLLIR